MSTITLKSAHRLIEAASAEAERIGVPMNIAVVDAGGNLTAFHRQDGAWIGSIAISQAKAYTARAFDMPTADLQPMVQPDQPLYGLEASDPGNIIAFPGGIPLTQDGQIIGAIGVSGGLVDQDQQVAAAGAAAL
ncbi:heme-binding protein [Patulibacter brassicae]|uniref:Heme-binding protein n=1 Tax=Patulibacter brassicae TaxID=1705717 RepID=A0ABU4VKI2_9ACTN|nr:heme-binding protein [Patulibacter brassicae]MDX8152335.1 heme-binding protein [Patulibacter brassicae]